MYPENKDNVQPIETAPTAQFNEHADQAVAIGIADKMPETTTEFETEGAKRARLATLGAKVGAIVAVPAIAIAAMQGGGSAEDAPKAPETGTYQVQPGESLSQVAQQVAENTPEKETMQEAAVTIRDMNHLGLAPQLGRGQELQITIEADEDKKTPGIQLEKPAENAEMPQSVVPDESGFNPSTPR